MSLPRSGKLWRISCGCENLHLLRQSGDLIFLIPQHALKVLKLVQTVTDVSCIVLPLADAVLQVVAVEEELKLVDAAFSDFFEQAAVFGDLREQDRV